MGLIFIRAIVVFVALFLTMRLMGKRQIGEMQPYELVITLIIADLACIPMADNSIPLTYGLVAIATVYLLHQIVCLLDLCVSGAKPVLSGKPSIVINKNGIDATQLKKNSLDITDLIESMRGAGYFSLDSVDYALYESNGTFSALPKPDYESKQNSLPVILINEGKYHLKNVALTHRSTDYYNAILRDHGFKSPHQVLIMTVDGNGKVYAQQRGKRYQTFNLNWEKKIW
ncbi:MAG: DUF421 domain-containing protein [Clostridia bacterium]|nr:DUF421 domain-containing protein [Clostridia bacterium]